MLNKRENTPMIPREESGRVNEQEQIFQLKDQKQIMDKIHRISILVLQHWMEKRMIGMEQLPTGLKVCVNAAMKSLAQTQNCWCMCRDRSKM